MNDKLNLSELREDVKKILTLLAAATASDKNRDGIYDNADMMQLLKVSRRTLSTWRETGVITFSQIGSKIYYSQDDIFRFLEKHRVRSMRNDRRRTHDR